MPADEGFPDMHQNITPNEAATRSIAFALFRLIDDLLDSGSIQDEATIRQHSSRMWQAAVRARPDAIEGETPYWPLGSSDPTVPATSYLQHSRISNLEDASKVGGTSLMGMLADVDHLDIKRLAKRCGLVRLDAPDTEKGYLDEYQCEIDGKPFTIYDRHGRWRFGCHAENQAEVAWALMNEGIAVCITQ